MIVAMDALHEILTKGFTSVFRIEHLRPMNPDSLIVIGIDLDFAVVDRARIRIRHFGPGFSFIVATKQSAGRMLDGCIYDVRVLAIEIDTDSSGLLERLGVQPCGLGIGCRWSAARSASTAASAGRGLFCSTVR